MLRICLKIMKIPKSAFLLFFELSPSFSQRKTILQAINEKKDQVMDVIQKNEKKIKKFSVAAQNQYKYLKTQLKGELNEIKVNFFFFSLCFSPGKLQKFRAYFKSAPPQPKGEAQSMVQNKARRVFLQAFAQSPPSSEKEQGPLHVRIHEEPA